jgi:class 3 adenylate cyclase
MEMQGSAGHSTPPNLESERKLVTILFADLSGFTALAEAMDPEDAREVVEAYFRRMTPIVVKYRGTIEKFIGDEIMAVFGAPVASENDAECALRAALEMLEEFFRFNSERSLDIGLHFGINTGLVIAGGLGTRGGEQYVVTGDAVNAAARLRSASQRNEIFLGGDTYRLTAELFEFEELAPLSVKGKSKPLEAYRLIRARRAAAVASRGERFRSPLVGREKEIQALRRALDELEQRKGSVVALLGEAGLGKSRLVAEVRQSSALGKAWVEARAVSFGEQRSYGVARTLIAGLCGFDEDSSTADAVQRLRAQVEAVLAEKTEEIFPYLARLCDLPLEAQIAERVKFLAPEALHGQFVRALQRFVRALASERGLVLAFEDLHWIDPSSLGLLETLLPLTLEAPLLVLAVARSSAEGRVREFFERALAASGARYQTIELAPLTPENSRELVKNLLQVQHRMEEPPLAVLDKAEGNPFFLEELLRGLVDAGLLHMGSGSEAVLSQDKGLEVPRTLQGLIAARIDRLKQPDKRAVQTASVIGRIFQQRILHNLMPSDQTGAPLEASLLELQRSDLIRPREAPRLLADRDYIFKHAITQEVTYQTLSLARRRELHRLCAEVFEALFPERLEEMSATLAYHYERAECSEQAIHFLTKAAEGARASYANEEAIRLYAAAIQHAGRLKSKARDGRTELVPRLQESLGDTLLRAARYDEARAAYREALSSIGENERVHHARLLRKQGESWFNQRRFEESLASYDLAETTLGNAADPGEAEWCKEWLAIGLARAGPYYHFKRLEELASLIEKVQPVLERFGTPTQRRDALDSLTLLELRGSGYCMPPESGLARTRQLLEDSRATGDLSETAYYQFELGFIHLHRDELGLAKQWLEAGLDLATRIGDVSEQTKCLTYLTLAHRKANRPEEAERCATNTLSLTREAQNSMYTGWALSHLAWAAWRRGNLAEAESQVRAALRTWPQDAPWRLWGLWLVLGISLTRQQIESAAACAREILDPGQCRMPADLTQALQRALAASGSSEPEKARAHFQQACELAERSGYL